MSSLTIRTPQNLSITRKTHTPIVYGAKVQYAYVPDASPHLDAVFILHVQYIVGTLLFYTLAVDNKPLVALSELVQQQA